MKIIICGGRDYTPTDKEKSLVKLLLVELKATEIVSGGYKSGVDPWGEDLAAEVNLPCKIFEAEWNVHQRSAGPIRNWRMAQYSDGCIGLTGNRGTANMLGYARKFRLKLADLRDGDVKLSWTSDFV